MITFQPSRIGTPIFEQPELSVEAAKRPSFQNRALATEQRLL